MRELQPCFGAYASSYYVEHYVRLAEAEKTGHLADLQDLTKPSGIVFRKPVLVKRGGFYGNTLLLTALSYNHTGIALLLISLAESSIPRVLSMPDAFVGALNTPLLLAAKTGNTPVAMTLLASEHVVEFIHATDHLGNTALHYACLMRNMHVVDALDNAGASFLIKNKNGITPGDYLSHEIQPHGLMYRYGQYSDGRHPYLVDVSDFGTGYYGTKDYLFSCYRWFIQMVVLNLHLVGKDTPLRDACASHCVYIFNGDHAGMVKRYTCPSDKLSDILQAHIAWRKPIMDARVFKQCCSLFEAYHHSKAEEALKYAQHAKMQAPVDLNENYFRK
ncbi:MAG: ankyrin repeat domain-containing protein [Coxiellaceae bacterium]|nr:ankyrin repeat domain-containing protein [Coxiellaceae bacterium]